MEQHWVHSAPYAAVPPFAVVGGHDCDGSVIYVGRSFHEGENLPAKVIPSKQAAYVAWGGVEHQKSHYEVLVGQGYGWVPCAGGSVPPAAVRTGTTRSGEVLYVGRGHHAGSLTVGKIHPSHGCLYIPFGGQEVRVNTYEVLVYNADQWVSSTPHYTPPLAVVGGYDTDKTAIFVGRAMHEAYKWVQSSAYSSIPPNAVVGGNDSDGDVMYVGRCMHEGDMLVAKIVPAKQIAFVSSRGEALPKDNFEVLCGENLVWRHCYDHAIPENAVICGRTKLDQPVYIGRGHYEGCLTVGKISSVHRALFIPYKGVERRLESYEVLVEEPEPVERPAGWALPLPASPPPPPPPPPQPMLVPAKVYPPLSSELLIPVKLYPPVDSKPPSYTPMPMPPMPMAPPMMGMPAASYPFEPPGPSPFDPPPPYPHVPTPAVYAPHRPPPPPPPAPAPPMHTRSRDIWMNATIANMPRNAVHAGHDADLSTIYVCRAFHNGGQLPGKAVLNRGYAYVCFEGQEIPKHDFEVLVGEGEHIWVPAANGSVHPGAVVGGRAPNGETLFVGRGHFCGSLTPGRIQCSHQCLYIPFGGHEQRLSNYEVLVRKDIYYAEQGKHMFY